MQNPRRPSGRVYAQVAMNMVDPDPLYEFCRIVGVGKVYGPYERQGGQPQRYWRASRRREVEHVVRLLGPYLSRRRRDRAAEVLARSVA